MAKADGRGRVVAAATDGACSGNPGPGGWGALIRFEDGSVEEFGGADPATTNNRMELQAALEQIEFDIGQRNRLRLAPYEVLLPSQVPNSIYI